MKERVKEVTSTKTQVEDKGAKYNQTKASDRDMISQNYKQSSSYNQSPDRLRSVVTRDLDFLNLDESPSEVLHSFKSSAIEQIESKSDK